MTSEVFSDVGVVQAREWLGDFSITSARIENVRHLEQSAVCELSCVRGDGSPVRCFLKRACEAWAPGNGASFVGEADFLRALRGGAWGALAAAGAPTPRPLHAEVAPGGVVTLALELLEVGEGGSFYEAGAPACCGGDGAVLGAGRGEAALLVGWLARFHAFWWDRPLRPASGERGGGWWKRRTVTPDVGVRIPAIFAAHAREFASIRALATPRAAQLWAALGRALPVLRAAADARPHRTLLHGDVKTSNCFFRRTGHGPPVVFDFQWVGGGPSGAADLAYFFCGGARCVALGGQGADAACEELLALYLEEFLRALPPGTPPPLTLEGLRQCVEEELVFYYAAAAGSLLDPLTPSIAEKNRSRYGWLLHEQFEDALLWLTRRVLRALEGWAASGRLAAV
jgi:hypothetical protein